MKKLVMLAVAALFVSTVESATIHVPSEQPTLQAGVDAGVDGDTILVAAGTYTGVGNYNVNFGARNLVLMSEAGYDSTVIDCFDSTGAVRRALILDQNQDSTSIIDGFTIRNATIGIFLTASAAVRNCTLDSNGTGVYVQGNPELDSLIIRNNDIGVQAENYGLARLRELLVSNNGKGVSLLSSSAAALACVVDSNGIGLEVYDGTLSIVNMNFNYNDTAVAGSIGPGSAPVTGEGCNFLGNVVGIRGECTVTDCTFDGGEIAVQSIFPDELVASGCTFTHITAAVVYQTPAKKAKSTSPGQAAGPDFVNPGADFLNCTLADNPGDVAVIYSGADGDVSSLVLDSCLVLNNGGGISVYGTLDMTSTLYAGNGGGIRYTVHKDVTKVHTVRNCTIVSNADTAMVVNSHLYPPLIIETNVIANNDGVGIAYIEQDTTNTIKVTCNDVYGNTGGQYGYILDQTGLNGNISQDPYFCLPDSGDFSIKDISPCAPANNPCSTLIGKYDTACVDQAPAITSTDSVSVYEDSLLVYRVTFADDDGPDTVISFGDLPSWLSADADSIFGTPANNTPDTSFSVVLSDGYKADSLMVAVTVIPVNDGPTMAPISPKELYEGTHLDFFVIASDIDGDTLLLTALDLPANSQYVDSGVNRGYFSYSPDFSASGEHIVRFIADDGVSSDTMPVSITVLDGDPVVVNLSVPSEPDSLHILSDSPLIQWSYIDPTGEYPQLGYQLLVTTDTAGTGDTLWWSDSASYAGDTVSYSGDTLIDGTVYYAGVRTFNGAVWSEWFDATFRTNAIPTEPVNLAPIADSVVTVQPVLYVQNSSDSDSDLVTYDYEISLDSILTEIVDSVSMVPEEPDSTGWEVTDSLPDDTRFYWRARAFDGYEYSDWTPVATFLLSALSQPPTVPTLVSPMDTLPTLYTLLPEFVWNTATDPDLGDTLLYTLYLSADSEFTTSFVYDSLSDTSYQATDSLFMGVKYWWKVAATDRAALTTESAPRSFWTWLSGDLNSDHTVDISDVIVMVDFMFNDGASIQPPLRGDVNGDCALDISDLIYLVEFAFGDGPAPVIGCAQ